MRVLLALIAGVFACVAADAAILPKRPPVDRHRADTGDWRLEIAHDRFSGAIVCRLRARDHRALYRSGAVGFRFGRGRDVGEAVYRLDGGDLRATRNDLPELFRLGTPIDTGGMANPTEGIVWIPLRLLGDANSVSIEPDPRHRARTFHFRGLKGLYELAQARGCPPDSRFVR